MTVELGADRWRATAALTESDGSDDPSSGLEGGRLSTLPQRCLSPTFIDDLVETYRAGTTISQLATDYGIHSATVATHID